MMVKAEVTCNKCNRIVRGTITVKDAKVVDSDGFMIFEDEAVCDTCLGDVPHRKM
ncbi:MAG: hypothetical protein KGH87_02475 [Thaumarchaeota archaeon]|nr:hypothetical protein [Nitrososphaerota archaeon]MDE1838764.1 hypothetical protein [Nitrososphaerota archaeon]